MTEADLRHALDAVRHGIDMRMAPFAADERPTVRRVGRDADLRVALAHRHLRGAPAAALAMAVADAFRQDPAGDGPVPAPALDRMVDRACRDVARRTLRERALARTTAPAVDVDDRGRPVHAQPPWTMLAHPILLQAAIRAGAVGGDRIRNGHVDGVDLDVRHDLVCGLGTVRGDGPPPPERVLADPDDPRRHGLSFACGTDGASLSTFIAIPDTALRAMPGRPIGDLFALPPCGADHVDRAAAACVVASVEARRPRPGGGLDIPASIRLAPTRWLPCAPAPGGGEPSWMRIQPVVR